MQKKLKNMDMTKGPILKQIVLFFIPVALGTFFQQMYNTVDALVVCCMVNIVLDLLFVSVLRMGVAGVALATVAAQSVSSIL